MLRSVHSVGIDVGDQDRATQGFTETLGFDLVQDTPMDPDPGSPRWTDVAPTDRNALLVLVTADEQRDRIATFSNVRFDERTLVIMVSLQNRSGLLHEKQSGSASANRQRRKGSLRASQVGDIRPVCIECQATSSPS